jgi:cytosine/adenosine deaminase-related metal-dependent hydrolase
VIDGCAVVTMDDAGTEHQPGHLVLAGGRIAAAAAGPAPEVPGAVRVDGAGCLATPGLIAAHHHLFQRLTRGLAQQETLTGWLAALYPVWARLDGRLHGAAVRSALAALALSGCSTVADHHYLIPRDGDDLLAVGVAAARDLGLRLHLARGALERGAPAAGLVPGRLLATAAEILDGTQRDIARFHDPSPGSMLRVAVAPATPLAVTPDLLRQSAALARQAGVRLHTHLAEDAGEDAACRAAFGARAVEHLERAGWLGPDVWLAHCVHLDAAGLGRLGRTGTGVAHCPSSNARLGAGIAPVPELLASGARVGLGTDGAANDHGGLGGELRQALLAARARSGPAALTARQALALATRGSASCLGRPGELGSLEVGKQADVALWRLDGLGHADIADPVAALVFGPPSPVELLTVAGAAVVAGGELRTADPAGLAADARLAARELLRRARA